MVVDGEGEKGLNDLQISRTVYWVHNNAIVSE